MIEENQTSRRPMNVDRILEYSPKIQLPVVSPKFEITPVPATFNENLPVSSDQIKSRQNNFVELTP